MATHNSDDSSEFTRSYVAENWERTLRDWEDRQSLVGFALLVLAFLGYGWISADPNMALIGVYIAAAYLVIRVCVITPMAMWNDSKQAVATYRQRLKPRLSFVFEPDVPPYVHLFHLSETGKLDRLVRLCRVGIRNDSAAIIKRVRVVLEAAVYVVDGQPVPPSPSQPALVEHALNVMGIDKKDGTVNLSPGDTPTAYIDVVEQMTVEGKQPDEWISLCYATKHRTPMFARNRWVFSLRVEGGGTYGRARFMVDGSAPDGNIVMSPYVRSTVKEQ